MTDSSRSELRDLRHNIFLQYTLVFCVYVLGIFAVLIISHCAVMQYHDAYKQGAFRLIEFRNQLRSIMAGDGFSFWSWYEGTGLDEPLENFVDPFSFIGSLFPDRYLELGFTCAALLRMYFGGIAFLILGREVGMKKQQKLIGAVLYVFSACFIGLALRQSEHLVNAYLFPLLITGVDRIYKGRSPLVFILTVAYYMLNNLYFAYMSAIAVVIYIVLRWFAYNDRFELRSFAASIGSFIGYGIVGIMITAFSSAFSAFTLMRASTDSSVSYNGLFFNDGFYLTFGKMLLGTGTTTDYLDIGLPILIILLLPIAVRHCTRRSTETIMTCILFVMLLIPFFGSMFNGFGYVSFRWTYIFVLFASWSAVTQFDTDRLREKGSIALACTGFAMIALWTFVLYTAGIISTNNIGKVFMPLQLAAGVLLTGVLLMMRDKDGMRRHAAAAVLVISLASLSAGWAYGFINTIDNFAKNAAVYKHLMDSTLRVGDQIEDDGFYRIDSVDGISRHAEIKHPSNENIWWKTNNLFIYNSRIPETLTEFNVEMGNSYGYARRVYVISNGNRLWLDFLYGVRYFLGSDSHKEGCEDSDNYADYGFEKSGVIDGVDIYKNKYDAGLGFVLDRAILKSDFDRLGRLEKEQTLLQAAVIPDDQADKCGDVPLVKPEDLDIEITDIPYEITATDGLTVGDGEIIADKDGASLTISVKDVPDSQLVLSFDGLLRNSKDGVSGASYEIYAEDDRVRKEVINQHSRQGVEGLKDHDLSMGHVKGSDDIKITFPDDGTYSFDRMYVSAMSTSNYDRYAEKCMDNAFEVSDYSDKSVKGSVDTDEDGILFLSVPAYDNWDIYIDGEKAEEIDDLDTTFFGAYIPEGKHEIALKYNNLYVRYGSIVSLLGVLLLVIIEIRYRRRAGGNDNGGRL